VEENRQKALAKKRQLEEEREAEEERKRLKVSESKNGAGDQCMEDLHYEIDEEELEAFLEQDAENMGEQTFRPLDY